MKLRWRSVLVFALVSVASFGQGTVYFSTRFAAAGVNAPAELCWDPVGAGPGPSYSAALYLQGAGGSLALIPTSLTVFRDGSENPLLAKYVEPVIAEVPGVLPGQSAVLVARLWMTSEGSYETAVHRMESMPFVIRSLGGNPNPPADLPSTFTGFLCIPEPGIAALGVLGALAMFGPGRRRN